jgi:hypothetical protein
MAASGFGVARAGSRSMKNGRQGSASDSANPLSRAVRP